MTLVPHDTFKNKTPDDYKHEYHVKSGVCNNLQLYFTVRIGGILSIKINIVVTEFEHLR